MFKLTKHCKTKHNCLPQVDCVCGVKLGTLRTLVRHKHKHFPATCSYSCKECKISYSLKSMYDAHMEARHGPNVEHHTCEICSKSFRNPYKLGVHKKTHLPDEIRRTFACEFCGKRFYDKTTLTSHIRGTHITDKVYTCELCGKGFNMKAKLQMHLIVHTDERKFGCDICSLFFKTRAALQRVRTRELDIIFKNLILISF